MQATAKNLWSPFLDQQVIQVHWCLGNVQGSQGPDVGERLESHDRGWVDSNKTE